MAHTRHNEGLQIEQELEFQRRSWIVQRIGWVLIALTLLAALLGLFGSGPLGRSTVGASDSALSIEYDRFGRLNGPLEYRVELAPHLARDGQVQLWLDAALAGDLEMAHITPQPEHVHAAGDRYIYTFALVDHAQRSTLVLSAQATRPGLYRWRAGLVGGQEMRFTQFIYP